MPFFDLGVPTANGLDLGGILPRRPIPPLGDAIDAVVIGAEEEQAAQEQRPCLLPWIADNPRFGKMFVIKTSRTAFMNAKP